MGSYHSTPPDQGAGDGGADSERLGDLLSGRLDDVSVDSVAAVRDVRERR